MEDYKDLPVARRLPRRRWTSAQSPDMVEEKLESPMCIEQMEP